MSIAVFEKRRRRTHVNSREQTRLTVPAPEQRMYFRVTGILNPIAAVLLLVPLLPVIAVLVVLVRITSSGPGIYRQIRVGCGGKRFVMYKIRTMRQDAESTTGPVWSSEHDLRTTRLGSLLRKIHVDEFPQLFNVIKRDMALIGPRPERPEFTELLDAAIPSYLERLRVKPGISGLAQFNLPPDTDLESVQRKLVLDLEYIRQAGPRLDGKIVACTLLRLTGLSGETCARVTGLNRYQRYVNRFERKQQRVARAATREPREQVEVG